MARRKKFRRERDLKIIAQRYLQGDYQADIAADLGVDQSTISNDLKELKRRWLDSSLVDFNTMRAQELAKIDAVELEAWAAWVRSCGVEEVIRQEGNKETVEKIVKTTRQNIGDKKFLDTIAWCIDRRCKMFGLDAPQQVEVYDWRKEVESAGISAADVFNDLVAEYVDAMSADDESQE